MNKNLWQVCSMASIVAMTITGAPIATGYDIPATAAEFVPVSKITEIKQRGKLIVSTKKEGEPSSSVHRDPAHFQKRNYEVAIAKAITQKLLGDEHKLEIEQLPLKERIPALEHNEVDLVISMLPITNERESQISFSHPYAMGGLALMVKKGGDIKRIDQLNHKRVAIVADKDHDADHEFLRYTRTKGIEITVDSYPTCEAAAAAVTAGKVEALVGNNINLIGYMQRAPNVFAIADGLLTHVQYGMAVKKGNDDLLNFINRTIDHMTASGELNILAERSGFPNGLRNPIEEMGGR